MLQVYQGETRPALELEDTRSGVQEILESQEHEQALLWRTELLQFDLDDPCDS